MSARFYADIALAAGQTVSLPEQTARHVQVLRLQPGEHITLFNGRGDTEGEFNATIERMGRSDVDAVIGAFTATQREAARVIHLVVSMPANDRMDWLVEKATELGAASIQPVMSERSVLRLKVERAAKKVVHWRGIAIAASEQCGRNRLMWVHEVVALPDWLKTAAALNANAGPRLLLSLRESSCTIRQALARLDTASALTFLSGPEGGLSAAEEAAAVACGFNPVTLGLRVLRAETAPLAVLAAGLCFK